MSDAAPWAAKACWEGGAAGGGEGCNAQLTTRPARSAVVVSVACKDLGLKGRTAVVALGEVTLLVATVLAARGVAGHGPEWWR